MARPTKNPILVHLPASLERRAASSKFPAATAAFTLLALMIPTTPNGRQQKMVTRIDSTSQFFGGVESSYLFGLIKTNIKSNNS